MGRLFWKFFLFIFLAQLTTTVGVGISIWLRHVISDDFYTVEGSGEWKASAAIDLAKKQLQDGGVNALRQHLQMAQSNFGLYIYAVDETGNELLGRAVPNGFFPPIKNSASLPGPDNHKRPLISVISPEGDKYFLIQEDKPAHKGIGPAPHDPKNPLGLPLMPIVLGFIGSLMFAGILAWYFSKPIRNLRNAIQSASKGQLDRRAGNAMGGRSDELADLARQFDDMADHLRNIMESQQRLLHDVSHELRSPLARQQAAIDLARQQPEKMLYSMDRLEKELNRMDSLVGEILALSRLDVEKGQSLTDEVDIVLLLKEICNDASFEAESNNVNVEFYDKVRGEVSGNHELLRRALENVIRNAIKHAPPDSTVSVATSNRSGDDQIRIEICDEGKGVPDNELESIFETFYRGKNTLGDGYGLGLAITRRIIRAHTGSVKACNRETGGLCVKLILPLIKVHK